MPGVLKAHSTPTRKKKNYMLLLKWSLSSIPAYQKVLDTLDSLYDYNDTFALLKNSEFEKFESSIIDFF